MKKVCVIFLGVIILLASQTLAFDFCENGIISENELRIVSVDDMLDANSQEWKWRGSEEIELEFRVENKDDKQNNYVLEVSFVKDGEEVEMVDNLDDLIEEFFISSNDRKTISFDFEVVDEIIIGEYELYVKLYIDNKEDDFCVENSEEVVEIRGNGVCEVESDKDKIEIKKIRDTNAGNAIDWEWVPGDLIELSVELNNKEYSSRDFELELILINENGIEIPLSKEKENSTEDIYVEEGKSERVNFNFELENGIKGGEYELYAVGTDSSGDICTSLRAEDSDDIALINIERAQNNILISGVVGPEDIVEGSKVSYVVEIVNLGKDTEEFVKVLLYSLALDLQESEEVLDIEPGESVKVNFSFVVPINSSNRVKMTFSTEFDYDPEKGYYKEESDMDDDIKYIVNVAEGIHEEAIIDIEEPVEEIVDVLINDSLEASSPITGAAVGSSSEGGFFGVVITLIVVVFVLVVFIKIKTSVPKKVAHNFPTMDS